MRVLNINQVGTDFMHKWPSGTIESFPNWIDYQTIADDGRHTVRVSCGIRSAHGRDRLRAIVWVGGHSHAQFFEADDFPASGDLLSEIKVRGGVGEVICRYPEDAIPARYAAFQVVGLPTRVEGRGAITHGPWSPASPITGRRLSWPGCA